MERLLERLETLEHHVRTLEQQSSNALRRLRWWRRLACSLAVMTAFGLPLSLGAADRKHDDRKGGNPPHHKPKDDDDKQGKGLAQRVRALERKLEHVTSEIGPEGFPELVITGANLRIVNGLGSTDCLAGDNPFEGVPIPDCPNGLGNLVVGYNEPRFVSDETVRTGSHNVVLGQGQNFARFGGIVAGLENSILGDFASVYGGTSNTASGRAAVVSGGTQNGASGPDAVVVGGGENFASGFGAVVSGGSGVNIASGDFASISGGERNLATGQSASISGGLSNEAHGFVSAVSGGDFNIASGDFASISGGEGNTASGVSASVSGGHLRMASGNFDWVAGALFQDE